MAVPVDLYWVNVYPTAVILTAAAGEDSKRQVSSMHDSLLILYSLATGSYIWLLATT